MMFENSFYYVFVICFYISCLGVSLFYVLNLENNNMIMVNVLVFLVGCIF